MRTSASATPGASAGTRCRLYSPAAYDGLPGMRFPRRERPFRRRTRWVTTSRRTRLASSFPCARERRVEALARADDRTWSRRDETFEADNVVVATGVMQKPLRSGSRASSTRASRRSTRATTATSPSCRRAAFSWSARATPEPTSPTRRQPSTRRSCRGPDTGQIPASVETRRGRIGFRALFFVGSHILTMDTPLGRKMRPHIRHGGAPLLRYRKKDLLAAGVERVLARTVGVQDGLPLLDDGRVLDVQNVIWCTGFRRDFSWIDVPFEIGDDGYPVQYRGVVESGSGPLLRRAALPPLVHVDAHRRHRRDAERVAKHIAARPARAEALRRRWRRLPSRLAS